MNQESTAHQGTLLTEARLKAPPSSQLIEYTHAPRLVREKQRFTQFLRVDMTHTVMLVEEGILSREDGWRILKRLRVLSDLGAGNFRTEPAKGSFLLQVEDFLFDELGEDVGGRMHTGRSRIDQGATVERLYARDRLLEVADRLVALQVAVCGLASENTTSIMPGYTHMQHAQPWVFGHYLLGAFHAFSEHFDRLVAAYERTNRNPLGTVGLSGTSWPLNRDRTTELLAFSGLVDNARLALEEYYAVEVMAVLSFIMSSVNDLASDFHLWSGFEFGFVETADSYCGSSSIFPQKKNPYALETIKKEAGISTTWMASALSSFRTEGSGDHAPRRVLQVDDGLEVTENMLDYLAGVVDTLIVHKDRMRALTSGNWSTSSNLADEIVRATGLSYRQTHHAVARMVRLAIERRIRPDEVTADLLDEAARETIGRTLDLDTGSIRLALDAEEFIRTRVTVGSPNESEIRRLLGSARRRLGRERRWIARQQRAIADAQDKLETAMDRIC